MEGSAPVATATARENTTTYLISSDNEELVSEENITTNHQNHAVQLAFLDFDSAPDSANHPADPAPNSSPDPTNHPANQGSPGVELTTATVTGPRHDGLASASMTDNSISIDETSDDENIGDFQSEDSGDRRYRLLREDADRRKAVLIDESFTIIKPAPGGKSYTWKVIDRSCPSKPVEDYDDIGMRGYDFATMREDEFPLSKIFLLLWPGNPRISTM